MPREDRQEGHGPSRCGGQDRARPWRVDGNSTGRWRKVKVCHLEESAGAEAREEREWGFLCCTDSVWDSLQAPRLHPQQPSEGGASRFQRRKRSPERPTRCPGRVKIPWHTRGRDRSEPLRGRTQHQCVSHVPGLPPRAERQQVHFQDISSVWPVHGDREGHGTGQRGLEEDDQERRSGAVLWLFFKVKGIRVSLKPRGSGEMESDDEER